MELSSIQKERYSRHIVMDEIGESGQKQLLNAKVLIIGAGGLGSPAAMYLAAAGVGTIGIADADRVDLSNLQRQIMHSYNDFNKPKVQSAGETLSLINSDVKINEHYTFIDETNIKEILENYDFIIDAADNFSTNLLISIAAKRTAKRPCLSSS